MGYRQAVNPGPENPRLDPQPIPNSSLYTYVALHCITWVHPRGDGSNAEN